MNMLRASMAALTAVVLAGATLDSQQPARPMSPAGLDSDAGAGQVDQR